MGIVIENVIVTTRLSDEDMVIFLARFRSLCPVDYSTVYYEGEDTYGFNEYNGNCNVLVIRHLGDGIVMDEYQFLTVVSDEQWVKSRGVRKQPVTSDMFEFMEDYCGLEFE